MSQDLGSLAFLARSFSLSSPSQVPSLSSSLPSRTYLPVRHRVPLVQHDHASPAGRGDRLRQPKVLRRRYEPPVARARRRVDDERDDVGAPHRLQRPPHGQPFGAIRGARRHGRAAPDTCGVDQAEQPRADAVGGGAGRTPHDGVDGVARRARNGAHDRAGPPGYRVQQARLARVGPAYNGDGERATGPAGVFR